MIRVVAIFVLLSLIAGVIAAAWVSLSRTGDERPMLEVEERRLIAQKLRRADRIPYYLISREQGPEFRLAGTDAKLRLISHVILRPGTQYDPQRRVRYGIRVRIYSDGETLVDHEIHTVARQSKDRKVIDADGNEIWLDENAFVRDPAVQITDDRLLPIYIPQDLPPNAVLAVTLLGTDVDNGLIRVYSERARTDRVRRAIARSLDARAQWGQVWTNTYEPWSMIPDDEKLSRLTYRTERLAVVGKSGLDYEIVTIRYTGFRLPLDFVETLGPRPLEVHRHRFAALNIQGPAQLRVKVEFAGDGSGAPAGERSGADRSGRDRRKRSGALEIEAVVGEIIEAEPEAETRTEPATDVAGAAAAPAAGTLRAAAPKRRWTVPAHPAPVPEQELSEAVIAIPPGLHSLHLTTRSPRPLHVWVRGPKQSLFGAPADVGSEIGRLYPDSMRIPVYVTGPDQPRPIEVAGVGDSVSPLGRRLRIDVRFYAGHALRGAVAIFAALLRDAAGHVFCSPALRICTGSLRESVFAGNIHIALYDRDGRLQRRTEYPVSSTRAPFEWLEFTAESPTPLAVSEPRKLQLIVPRSVFRIELSSSRPAALRLFRYLPGEQLYQLPYRQVALDSETTTWRYARLEKRIWWPMRPLNLTELAGGGGSRSSPRRHGQAPVAERKSQLASLAAQVRLQERGADGDQNEAASRGRPVAVHPIGQHERHEIIEPIAPDRTAGALARWGAGMLAELPIDREATYLWDPEGYRDARVHYWIDPADLGRELTIEIDGRPEAIVTMSTTSGSLDLPATQPGSHRVRGRTDAESLRLYIDQEPQTTNPGYWPAIRLYKRREVYAMGRAPLPLRVRRVPGRQPRLYAVLYAPWREVRAEVAVRCLIGGGKPLTREGAVITSFTVADREVPLPAANRARPAQFADVASGSPGYPRVISMRLGDDLVSGSHIVECYSVSGYRLWARFFVTDSESERSEDTLQWRLRDPRYR